MQQEIYLIISNYAYRNTKIQGAFTKETVSDHYSIMDACKPESWLREKVGPYNIKYYSIDDDGNKNFQEQLYIQKQLVVGS